MKTQITVALLVVLLLGCSSRKALVLGHVVSVQPRAESMATVSHRASEALTTITESDKDCDRYEWFEKLVGAPDASLVSGDTRYWYFYCSDGVYVITSEAETKSYGVLNVTMIGQVEQSYIQ